MSSHWAAIFVKKQDPYVGKFLTIPFIDLSAQYRALKPTIQSRINAVLEHGQYIMGAEVRELEERLENFTSTQNCITVSSGTDALLISLMALGVGPGDEVITTPFSFAATAEVIILLGAAPIFVDIEKDSCNIDATLIESKITRKTKAIMPVSLYGQPANMHEINELASRHGGIPVIEDAAQSFGAMYHGKRSCSLSTVGCTSFFPSKPLGCYGDGGAIFTDDEELAQVCREIRVHGQSSRYLHTRLGIGGRMDTMQCAIVLAKLERFEWEIERRIEIGERYNYLMDNEGISRVQQRADRSSVFAQYTIMISERSLYQQRMKKHGIPTSVHYPMPLNAQKAYKRFCNTDETPNALKISNEVLSLPMGPDLKPSVQDDIVCTFVKLMGAD